MKPTRHGEDLNVICFWLLLLKALLFLEHNLNINILEHNFNIEFLWTKRTISYTSPLCCCAGFFIIYGPLLVWFPTHMPLNVWCWLADKLLILTQINPSKNQPYLFFSHVLLCAIFPHVSWWYPLSVQEHSLTCFKLTQQNLVSAVCHQMRADWFMVQPVCMFNSQWIIKCKH